MASRSAVLAALASLALLGACAAGPAYPLLTPVDIAHDFGFSDLRLPDGRYQVSYVAPPIQGYGYRYDQSPSERQGKSLAFDMAIWRAAQIAQTQGFKGFSIADSKSNSDIQRQSGYYDGPWGGAWGGGPWGGPWGGWGWRDPAFAPSAFYNPPQATVQVEVQLSVALSNDLKPGDYDAANAIDQLRRTYPGADGGTVVAPGTVPGPTVTPIQPPAPNATPKT